MRDRAGAGAEVHIGIFGVDSTFNDVPGGFNVLLRKGKFLSGGNHDLGFNQIDASEHFCNSVFDLNSGVEFDKIELSRFIDDELDCPGVCVSRLFDQSDCRVAHGFSGRFRNVGRWGFLDELLVSALHRAIAFIKMNDVAEIVRHELDFNVPRVLDVLFDINVSVAERSRRFGFRLIEPGNKLFVVSGDAHSASSAAGCRFDENRIAELSGDFERFVFVFD